VEERFSSKDLVDLSTSQLAPLTFKGLSTQLAVARRRRDPAAERKCKGGKMRKQAEDDEEILR